MTAVNPRRSLELLDPEQELLNERIARLSPSELETPSNLARWSVADLAVHITRVCDSIHLAVQRAVAGDRTPAFGAAARPREDEIRARGPQGWSAHGRDCCQRITQIVAGLSDDQLDRCTFPHPFGERSIGWFCTQLLTEVAFHRWDLNRSLGQDGPLPEDLAAYVLPFMLDRDEPVFGARKTQGGDQIFTLASDAGSWRLAVTADGTTTGPVSSSEGAVISGSPGWLCLAVYGRVRADTPPFSVTGPGDTADRFAAIFGPAD